MDGVLMDVVEPGEVAPLMSEMGFPEVLPEPGAAGLIVAVVELAGGQAVEFPDHFAERRRSIRACRAVADEVIVIRENGPCFQGPAELVDEREEGVLEPVLQVVVGEKMMSFRTSGGEKVDTGHAQSMGWRMWPVQGAFRARRVIRQIFHDRPED